MTRGRLASGAEAGGRRRPKLADRRLPGESAGALAAALLLLAAAPAAASTAPAPQEAPADTLPPDSARRAPPVVVTVTRTGERLREAAFPLSVVDAGRALAPERRTTLGDVLDRVPGVQVDDRRNFSLGDRITVRGVGSRAQFGVRGIQVLVDGIPLTLPDGQATLTNLDLGSAQRVEVLRGPASALYGNASGGVIRVRSGPFSEAKLAASPRVVVGAEGFRQEELRASGRAAGVRYLIHGSHLRTDGFRDHASAETYRANLVLGARPGGATEVRAVLNAFDTPFAQNPSSLDLRDAHEEPRKARAFVVSQGAGESATQGQAGLTLRHRLGGGERVRATVWGLVRDLRNPIPGRIIEVDRGAAGLRLEHRGEGRPGGLPLAWTVGLDASLQDDDRRELENLGVGPDGGPARAGSRLLDQRERVSYWAPFAQLRFSPSPGLRLTAAGRLDRYRFRATDRLPADGDDSGSRTLAEVSPALGLAWAALPGVDLYASYATAFETPTTSELSNRPDGGGGFHPGLEPQLTRSFEAGLRGRAGGTPLRWSLSVYRADVEGALVPVEGPDEQVFFRNAGALDREGVEASLTWRPAPRLEADLAYAFQDFRYEAFRAPGGDFSGNRQAGAPDHRVFAELRWRAPAGLEARTSFTWTDAYPVDDANTVWNWSSRVVDLRLSWEGKLGGWEARPFLGVDNVFDERYNASVVPNAFGGNYFEPAPGREAFLGLSVGTPGG